MGKLYAVGIGPGSPDEMTGHATHVLEGVRVIAGYHGYLDLIRPLYPDKEYIDTPMRPVGT